MKLMNRKQKTERETKGSRRTKKEAGKGRESDNLKDAREKD